MACWVSQWHGLLSDAVFHFCTSAIVVELRRGTYITAGNLSLSRMLYVVPSMGPFSVLRNKRLSLSSGIYKLKSLSSPAMNLLTWIPRYRPTLVTTMSFGIGNRTWSGLGNNPPFLLKTPLASWQNLVSWKSLAKAPLYNDEVDARARITVCVCMNAMVTVNHSWLDMLSQITDNRWE